MFKKDRIVLILGLSALLPLACGQETLEIEEESGIRLALEASYPQPFSRLTRVRELSTGRVIAADPIDQLLLSIDLDSGQADTLGRVGEGPDEYLQPDGVLPLPGDSTLFLDLGNGRLTVVAPDGAFHPGLPVAQQGEDGALALIMPRYVDSEWRLYFQGTGVRSLGQGAGPPTLQDSVAIERFDRHSGQIDTLAMVKLAEWQRQDSGPLTRLGPGPYSPQDDWAVGWDGRLAVIRTGDFSVDWVLPNGSYQDGLPTEYAPVPVTLAEKEAWVSGPRSGGIAVSVRGDGAGGRSVALRLSGREGEEGPSIEGQHWPEVLPPFRPGSTVVAPDGNVWVERYLPSGQQPLINVFDPAGRMLGEVVLPPGRRLIGFGEGTAYLIHFDEFDLIWLERYGVRLPNGPST